MKPIYLDNATASKPSERAISRMLPFLTEKWGLPTQGAFQKIQSDIDEASSALLSLVGGQGQFIFTNSREEAFDLVIDCIYSEGMAKRGKNQIVTTLNQEASLERAQNLGLKPRFITGTVTEESLIDVLTPRTVALSLSLVDGLTGVVQRMSEIAGVCEERGVWLHLDVTHALGKMEINFEDTGATFLTFGGEAMHAPLGSGGLFIRDLPCHATPPLTPASLIALGQAAIEASDAADFVSTEIARLRGLFETRLLEAIPMAKILFKEHARAPHISAFSVPGISAEAFCYALANANVFTKCGPQFISAALSRETTDEEVRRASLAMKAVYEAYRPLILEC